jgi:hypothetical protein
MNTDQTDKQKTERKTKLALSLYDLFLICVNPRLSVAAAREIQRAPQQTIAIEFFYGYGVLERHDYCSRHTNGTERFVSLVE